MLPSQRDGCLLVRHSPLGYDGSIAYPWCLPQRVRSRRVKTLNTKCLRNFEVL